jgi:vancomycin permeability regulator SanA
MFKKLTNKTSVKKYGQILQKRCGKLKKRFAAIIKIFWNLKSLLIIFTFIFSLFIAIPPLIVYRGKYKIYREIDNVDETKIGIVFGAGVTEDHQPSDMLEDRLVIAKKLYESEKIERILVSGDNRVSHYNEPQVMYEYLINEGLPSEKIVRDYAGRRTYDTCYRAKEIFDVKEAILISQGYHLPRAIFLCEQFGITSSGYSATIQPYINERFYKTREILALYKSVLDVYIITPTPILGKKEKIE